MTTQTVSYHSIILYNQFTLSNGDLEHFLDGMPEVIRESEMFLIAWQIFFNDNYRRFF